MFITNKMEFNAAADQLEAYLLIENPTNEEKQRHSELAVYMDMFIMVQPVDQIWMH